MRNYLKVIVLCILAATLTVSVVSKEDTRSSETSLQELMEGNKRFRENAPLHALRPGGTHEKSTDSQSPIAAILSCSDSRVPPEIIFDQWIGDIFVVRNAGNVASRIEIDSLEFAANTLKAPLIVVLGHSGCGAVTAVLENQAKQFDIEGIAPFIQPAVNKSKKLHGDSVEEAIKMNAYNVVETLKESEVLQKLIKEKKLMIVPAYYDIKSQQVTILPTN